MKRILAMFLTCTMILSGSSWFTRDVFAAKKKNAESSTKTEASTEVNLIDTKEPAPIPLSEENQGTAYGLDGLKNGPDITAESAILMDAKSGEILFSKQANEKRYPASITKVMTTLIAIENCKMDDIVEFTSSAVYGIEEGSSTAGINVGAQLTVEETLYALMLVSANEAGAAIAEHVSGSVDDFAKLMTSRAKELGCTNTNFKNPHGLPDQEHYTTAHDFGLIVKEALKHEEFRKFASTINYTIENPTLTSSIDLWNHAKILRKNSEYYYEYAVGAKTGFTQAARNTLITYADKDDVELLCVILKDYGADCSYYDTRDLYKWGFDQVKNIQPLADFDLNAALSNLENVKEEEIQQYISLNANFAKDYPVLVKKDYDGKNLSKSFRLEEDVKKGQLGFIDVKAGDKLIFSTPVLYDTKSEAAKNYLTKQGGGDDLETAKVVNKNSLLRKAGVFLLRIAIAFILIFVIMQLIHRWQLEQNRKKRILERNKKRQESKKNANTSGKTGKGSGNGGVKRKRRSK